MVSSHGVLKDSVVVGGCRHPGAAEQQFIASNKRLFVGISVVELWKRAVDGRRKEAAAATWTR